MEKTKSSKSIYNGRIINVINDTVLLSNGREAQREIVIHNGSVCMLPIDLNKNIIYLVKQYRYAVKDYLVEIPAGTIKKGEDAHDCASRELKEEIKMQAGKIVKMAEIFPSPGFITEKMHVFLCTALTECVLEHDFDEEIEIVKINLDEFEKMIKNNKIKDGKTITAYLLWKNIF